MSTPRPMTPEEHQALDEFTSKELGINQQPDSLRAEVETLKSGLFQMQNAAIELTAEVERLREDKESLSLQVASLESLCKTLKEQSNP